MWFTKSLVNCGQRSNQHLVPLVLKSHGRKKWIWYPLCTPFDALTSDIGKHAIFQKALESNYHMELLLLNPCTGKGPSLLPL